MLLHDRMRHAYDPSHVLHDPLRQCRANPFLWARACALVTRTPDDPCKRPPSVSESGTLQVKQI